MSVGASGAALLAASAGVAFGHAILPDHWVPLAVLGRTRRYPLARVTRLSGMAGIAHVLVSFVLGAIVIVVGLQFRSAIQNTQDAIVGGILIATGLGFAVLELTGHGHHHDHDHDHDHGHGNGHGHAHDHSDVRPTAQRSSGLAAVMVPFGAAASPDLTILPVFLAATTAGIGIAIGSLLIFAAVTIGTIVGLTVGATRGGYELKANWLEQWGNAFTAVVLVIVGGLVLAGII
jgi:nickel/cobalt transporter (NicO) family protein